MSAYLVQFLSECMDLEPSKAQLVLLVQRVQSGQLEHKVFRVLLVLLVLLVQLVQRVRRVFKVFRVQPGQLVKASMVIQSRHTER